MTFGSFKGVSHASIKRLCEAVVDLETNKQGYMNQAEKIKLAQTELFEKQNPRLAETLLLEVAQQGNGHACHELGVLYAVGCGDLKVDREKSVFWLDKSVELGFEQTIASDPLWYK